MIDQITTPEQKAEVEAYVTWAKNRSERERQAEVKKVSVQMHVVTIRQLSGSFPVQFLQISVLFIQIQLIL